MLQIADLQESRWLDDRVPELVWIALLMHVFGSKGGIEVAEGIAKAAAQCVRDRRKHLLLRAIIRN